MSEAAEDSERGGAHPVPQPQLPPSHLQLGPHLQGEAGQSPPHAHCPPFAHPHDPSSHLQLGPQEHGIVWTAERGID